MHQLLHDLELSRLSVLFTGEKLKTIADNAQPLLHAVGPMSPAVLLQERRTIPSRKMLRLSPEARQVSVMTVAAVSLTAYYFIHPPPTTTHLRQTAISLKTHITELLAECTLLIDHDPQLCDQDAAALDQAALAVANAFNPHVVTMYM